MHALMWLSVRAISSEYFLRRARLQEDMQCLQKHREGADKEQPALASAVLARARGERERDSSAPW